MEIGKRRDILPLLCVEISVLFVLCNRALGQSGCLPAHNGTCLCHGGFTGDKCDEDIDECLETPGICLTAWNSKHVCVNVPGGYKCGCSYGHYSESPHGFCERCPHGRYGYDCTGQCKCDPKHTLFCHPGDGACICLDGWDGKHCTDGVDDCRFSDCPPGTCVDKDNGYECFCSDGHMMLNGECVELKVLMHTKGGKEHNVGAFVDFYLFLSLHSLYFQAPHLFPKIKFEVKDDQTFSTCGVELKTHAPLTGKEAILAEIDNPTNMRFDVCLQFRMKFLKAQDTTVTVEENEHIHKKIVKKLRIRYGSTQAEICLSGMSIPGTGVDSRNKPSYKRQSYMVFEVDLPLSSTCYESPRVMWEYYQVPEVMEEKMCRSLEEFTKLDIDDLTQKGGGLLMSDHHQPKEIIAKNTLPLGNVMLCVIAYVERDQRKRAVTCGYIRIIPSWTIVGKMRPASQIATVSSKAFILVNGVKTFDIVQSTTMTVRHLHDPDLNLELKATWRCLKPKAICDKYDFKPNAHAENVTLSGLKPEETYEFEVEVTIPGHPQSTITRTMTLETTWLSLTMHLICLENCDAIINGGKIMVLRLSEAADYPLQWTVIESPQGNPQNKVVYQGLGVNQFRIKKWDDTYFFSKVDAFKAGHTYTIKCRGQDDVYVDKMRCAGWPKSLVLCPEERYMRMTGHTSYTFQTLPLPVGKGCIISPTQGKAVFTKFNITCEDYHDPVSDLPLVYKLYQRILDLESNKEIKSLVAYSNVGTLLDVTLSSESPNSQVMLEMDISTMQQTTVTEHLAVDLTTDTQKEILSKTASERGRIGNVGSQEDLRLMKDVATIMKAASTVSNTDKTTIRSSMLGDMKNFEAIAGDTIEHSSTVLWELAAREDEVDEDGLANGLQAAERITKYLGKTGGGNIVLIKDVASLQVSAMNKLVKISSDQGKQSILSHQGPVAAAGKRMSKEENVELRKNLSKRTVTSMSQILTTLRAGFEISTDPIQIKKDSLEVLLEVNDFQQKRSVQLDKDNVGFSIDSKNLNFLGNGSVESEYSVYDKSPFTGISDRVHGDMPVVKVNFVERNNDPKAKKVKSKDWHFSKPADIFLKNRNKNDTGIDFPTLLFVNNQTDEVHKSSCIELRIKVSTTEATVLEFANDGDLELKAKARYTNSLSAFSLLSDYEMVSVPFTFPDNAYKTVVENRNLSRSKTFLFLPRLSKKQIDHSIKYYHVKIGVKIGHVLGANFDKGAHRLAKTLQEIVSSNNLTLDPTGMDLYNVTISITPHKLSCIHFDESKLDYSYDSCELSVFTSNEELHCRCVVAAAFSASYFVVPRLLDPTDVDFEKVFENPLVVSMVIGLWLTLFALLVWGRRKDKADEIKRGATALEDNHLADSYVYLVCVVTGASAYAGTTSEVFMYLRGSWGQSNIHAMKDNNRALFEAGAENWFVLTTESDLGYLKSAVVWTDYSGGNPSWFLYNIYVQNVQTGETWNMMFNSWLSVVKGSKHIMAELPAIPENSGSMGLYKKFLGKGRVDIRNEHLWFGMLFKTSFNKFTRFRRLCTAFTMLQTLMILNLAFSGKRDKDDSRQFVHMYGYRLHLTSLIISIQSALIMSFFGIGLSFTFNRISQKKPPSTNKDTTEQVHQIPYSIISTIVGKELNLSDKKLQDLLKILGEKYEEAPKEKPPPPPADVWWMLPWWVIYLYWGFLIVYNILAAYFIMGFGLDIGYERSVNWLFSFFAGFGFNVLIVQPLKVLGMVLFLVIVYKQTHSLKAQAPFTTAVNASSAVAKQKKSSVKTERRTLFQHRHRPPSKLEMKDIMRRLMVEMSAREMLRDMILYFVFLTALLTMTYLHSPIKSSFLQTKAMNRMLFKSELTRSEEAPSILDEIGTTDDIWTFLSNDVIPFLISESEDDLNVNSFYFLGTARIRQVRVERDESGCDTIPSNMMDVYRQERCTLTMPEGREETRDFNQSWHKPTVFSLDVEEEDDDNVMWTYKSASELNTASISAPLATYPGGGYVLTLPRYDPTGALAVVKRLSESSWVDQLTRCLLVEFTTYNPDANLFTYVVVGFEFTVHGGPSPFKIVTSARLYQYEKNTMAWMQMSEVTVAMCTAFYTFIVLKAILREGFVSFITNIWNFVDILILSLVYTMALFTYLRNAEMIKVLSVFAQYGNNRFLDFQAVFQKDYALFLAEGFLGGVAFVKLIYVMRFNPFSKTFMKSVDVAKQDIFGYTVVTVLTMLGFSVAALVIFGRFMYNYFRFERCLLSLLFFLMGEVDYDLLVEANRVLGPAYFVLVLCATQYVVLNFFVAMIRDGLDMARSIEYGKEDATIKYMLDALKLYLGIGSNRQKGIDTLQTQRRGSRRGRMKSHGYDD